MKHIPGRNAFWLFLLLASCCMAQTNIALNCPYTLEPTPTYSLCSGTTNGGTDLTDLTDGVNINANHTNALTVGWQNTPAVVTIDLGSNQAIEGFSGSFNYLPAFIAMWVSTDGSTFAWAGELIADSKGNGLPVSSDMMRGTAKGPWVYEVHNKVLAGRYVKFAIFAGTAFIFTDELEVFGGSFDPGTVTPHERQVAGDFATVKSWLYDNKYHFIAKNRMLYDLLELEAHPFIGGFAGQLLTLRNQVEAMPWVSDLTFENGLPYNTLEADIWSLYGQLQTASGKPAHAIGAAELYDPVHPFDDINGGTTLSIEMLGNEKRAAAMNIANCSTAAKSFDITLNWQGTDLNDAVTLHQVRFTDTQRRCIVGEALPVVSPSAAGQWTISIPAGAIGQVLFSLDSAAITPGDYAASIAVTPDGAATMNGTLNLTVHQGQLPDDPVLSVGIWDYTSRPGSYPATVETNIDVTMALHREYRITSPWLHPGKLFDGMGGTWNTNGTYATAPVFLGLREWLTDLQNNATYWPLGRYYLFLNSGYGLSFQGFGYDSTEWHNAVQSFVNAVADVFDDFGIDPSAAAILVQDEPPHGSPDDDRAAQFIVTGQAAGSGISFFVDPTVSSTSSITTPLSIQIENCNEIMPSAGRLRGSSTLVSYYQNVTTANGAIFGTYSATDGGRERSPSKYFRRMCWEAQKWGMGSVGVWTGSSVRTNTWDDFGSVANYELPLRTATTATAGKMMMAFRDGSQDFGYFKLLEELISQAQTLGADPAVIANAISVMDSAVTTALAEVSSPGVYWETANYNSTFDRARIPLLNAIDEVTAAIPEPLTPCEQFIADGHGHITDINDDCRVDMTDLAMLADDWLGCTQPGDPACEPVIAVESYEPWQMPYGSCTVDGDLSDWSDASWVVMGQVYYGDPADASDARYAVRWTENTVYMAVSYIDSDHKLADFEIAWNGQDCIESHLDAANADEDGYNTTDYDTATQWFTGPEGDVIDDVSATWTGGTWQSLGNFADCGSYCYEAATHVDSVTGEIVYELAMPAYAHRTTGELVTLQAGDIVGCDVVIDSKSAAGFGVLSANADGGKYADAGAFQDWNLVIEPYDTRSCGDWGYRPGDINTDCHTNLLDFAMIAAEWMLCYDPDPHQCPPPDDPDPDPMTPCEGMFHLGFGRAEDVNQDCHIDIFDLLMIADHWLETDAGNADIVVDGVVNLLDVAGLINDWMTCYDPDPANCRF